MSIKPALAFDVVFAFVGAVPYVQDRVVSLAKAIPESAYEWRPGEGVRSVSEVFRHIAGENYFVGAKFGAMVPPPATVITGASHQSSLNYEERKMTRAEIIAALEHSFMFLRDSIERTDGKLDSMTEYSKRTVTLRNAWFRSVNHLHEHLGQLIAYARSNKVVPPWSK